LPDAGAPSLLQGDDRQSMQRNEMARFPCENLRIRALRVRKQALLMQLRRALQLVRR
jgi:hypothetical protein